MLFLKEGVFAVQQKAVKQKGATVPIVQVCNPLQNKRFNCKQSINFVDIFYRSITLHIVCAAKIKKRARFFISPSVYVPL